MWMLQQSVPYWSITIQYNKHKVHLVGKIQQSISNSLKPSDRKKGLWKLKWWVMYIYQDFPFFRMLIPESLLSSAQAKHILILHRKLEWKYMTTSDIYIRLSLFMCSYVFFKYFIICTIIFKVAPVCFHRHAHTTVMKLTRLSRVTALHEVSVAGDWSHSTERLTVTVGDDVEMLNCSFICQWESER